MTSQYKGVDWRARIAKFRARILVQGRQLDVGMHRQEQQAVKARDKWVFAAAGSS